MKKQTIAKATMIQTIFVAIILVVSSCGFNQKSQDTKDIAEEQNEAIFDNNQKMKDAQFLVNAAEINMGQIEVGQLAQQKGTTTHVKELGKTMEDAHTKLQRDLTALANRKSITIPTSPTDDIRDAYKNLNEKAGNDFDKAYADMMVSNHKDAIDVFEDAAQNGYDADIKQWASATLPNLRKHRDHSLDCQKKCDELK
jgi:putative membrane protein